MPAESPAEQVPPELPAPMESPAEQVPPELPPPESPAEQVPPELPPTESKDEQVPPDLPRPNEPVVPASVPEPKRRARKRTGVSAASNPPKRSKADKPDDDEAMVEEKQDEIPPPEPKETLTICFFRIYIIFPFCIVVRSNMPARRPTRRRKKPGQLLQRGG